jgi:hypothetical protein
MKQILTLCAVMLSMVCEAQTNLPGQCQVGLPKIINSELIKEKDVKQLIRSSDWGQSNRADRYWVVYSDRENNVTYNKPDKSSGRFSNLNFNEELRIAKLQNGFALVYKEEKTNSVYPKINKGVSRGWVPMTHLLLWNSCPTNDLGIYRKALPVINVDEYIKQKDSNIGKIFKNPVAKSSQSRLMTGMDFYFVMKEDKESGLILLSRLCNLVGTTSQVLYGWVSKSSFVPWNQRSCLEPNWNREAAEKFASLPDNKKNVPVYRKTNLTDLACTMPLGRTNNLGKRATMYRMYPDEMRYPLLDNDEKKDKIFKVTAFARPDGKGHVARIRNDNDKTKIKLVEDKMKDARVINLIFVIDGTNSMKDFYNPVQKIIQEANNYFGKQEGNVVKCGAVIYRDYPDKAFCTEYVPMTSPTNPVLTTFLKNGGKYGIKSVAIPETEALYKGLELALDADKMHFSPKNSNMMFVIGDCGNDPEDKKCLSENELVKKCVATRMQVSAFQVFNGTSQAYKLFRRQLNRLISESLNGQYHTNQVKGLVTKWRDLEDGYEFSTNLPDEQKFYIGNTRYAPNGEKMNVAKLYDIVKDSYIQFNTAIEARVAALLHSDEWVMYDDETVTERTAAAQVNLNFLENAFGKEGLRKLKEDNMLTAFEGYTKKTDDDLGEDYWKPVIYISEDEFKDLMSNLQGVMTAVSTGSEDRRPYVNAMKTLVRTMIPDITEAQMQQKGNKEIMAMVAGLNVSSDALRGRTLEEIQDNTVVSQAEFQGLISNFMDKFNKLDQMRTSEYQFSIMRNGTRWFWIPVSDLP